MGQLNLATPAGPGRLTGTQFEEMIDFKVASLTTSDNPPWELLDFISLFSSCSVLESCPEGTLQKICCGRWVHIVKRLVVGKKVFDFTYKKMAVTKYIVH